MENAFSRRTFSAALLSILVAPQVHALSFGNKNRGGERPYFSMLLPAEYDAMDVAFQSFAMDDRANRIYGQFATRTDPSQTIIAEYELIPDGEAMPLSMQLPSMTIGHQGLSLQHAADGVWMWAAAPGHTRDVVRFRYAAGGHADVTSYTLFDSSFPDFAITVAVSYDGRWLIASSRKRGPSGGTNVVRVFDLDAVLRHPSGDCSQLAKYEWNIPTYPRLPVQGLACYDGTVAVSYGTSRAAESKPVLFFTLDGNDSGAIPDINPGKDEVRPKWSYEPEGLCFSRVRGSNEPLLFVGVTTGRADTGRNRYIYVLK